MQHELHYNEYIAISSLIEKKNRTLMMEYPKTLDKLAVYWLKKLGHNKVAALMLVAGRTLKYGKLAAEIPFEAFENGGSNGEGWSFCGLGVSHNTIRHTLKALVQEDFLHTYFPKKTAGASNALYKYYEINFKKIQNLRYTLGEIIENLCQANEKRSAKPPANQGHNHLSQTGGPSGQRVRRHLMPSQPTKIENNSDRGLIVDVARPRKRPLNGSSYKRNLQSISKSPSATFATAGPVVDIIQVNPAKQLANVQKAKANTATNDSSLMLSRADIKRIVDDAMRTYHKEFSLIPITNIPFGAFHKKVKEAKIPDLCAFITWCIRSWDQISSGHLEAIRRRQRNGTEIGNMRSSPMPRSPDFPTLAYRFNYFLAAYNNKLVQTAHFGTKEDKVEKENAKLKVALAEAKREIVVTRNVAQKALRNSKLHSQGKTMRNSMGIVSGSSHSTYRIRRTNAVSSMSNDFDTGLGLGLDHDEYIPTWEEIAASEIVES